MTNCFFIITTIFLLPLFQDPFFRITDRIFVHLIDKCRDWLNDIIFQTACFLLSKHSCRTMAQCSGEPAKRNNKKSHFTNNPVPQKQGLFCMASFSSTLAIHAAFKGPLHRTLSSLTFLSNLVLGCQFNLLFIITNIVVGCIIVRRDIYCNPNDVSFDSIYHAKSSRRYFTLCNLCKNFIINAVFSVRTLIRPMRTVCRPRGTDRVSFYAVISLTSDQIS